MHSPMPKLFRNTLTAHLTHCTWIILPHQARTVSVCIIEKWPTAKFPLKQTQADCSDIWKRAAGILRSAGVDMFCWN